MNLDGTTFAIRHSLRLIRSRRQLRREDRLIECGRIAKYSTLYENLALIEQSEDLYARLWEDEERESPVVYSDPEPVQPPKRRAEGNYPDRISLSLNEVDEDGDFEVKWDTDNEGPWHSEYVSVRYLMDKLAEMGIALGDRVRERNAMEVQLMELRDKYSALIQQLREVHDVVYGGKGD